MGRNQLFFLEALLDLRGCVSLDLGQEARGELVQRLPARARCQVVQADRLTVRPHPALVMALAGPCEAGLEQVVAGQPLEVLDQLSPRELQLAPFKPVQAARPA